MEEWFLRATKNSGTKGRDSLWINWYSDKIREREWVRVREKWMKRKDTWMFEVSGTNGSQSRHRTRFFLWRYPFVFWWMCALVSWRFMDHCDQGSRRGFLDVCASLNEVPTSLSHTYGVSSLVRMCEGTQSKIKNNPTLLLVNQSLSWIAWRSSSVALVTSCTCLAWTSDLMCCTVELDRLTEFPLPNFGRGMRTRWTSLNQVSIFIWKKNLDTC